MRRDFEIEDTQRSNYFIKILCLAVNSITSMAPLSNQLCLRAGEDRQKIDLDQRSRSNIWSRSKIKITQDHLQWSRSITRSKIKINYYIHWKPRSTCCPVPMPKSVLTDKIYLVVTHWPSKWAILKQNKLRIGLDNSFLNITSYHVFIPS